MNGMGRLTTRLWSTESSAHRLKRKHQCSGWRTACRTKICLKRSSTIGANSSALRNKKVGSISRPFNSLVASPEQEGGVWPWRGSCVGSSRTIRTGEVVFDVDQPGPFGQLSMGAGQNVTLAPMGPSTEAAGQSGPVFAGLSLPRVVLIDCSTAMVYSLARGGGRPPAGYLINGMIIPSSCRSGLRRGSVQRRSGSCTLLWKKS